MKNPLEASIQSAVKANHAIGDSIARLGTKEHPKGFVLSAFRAARRDLAYALRAENAAQAAADVLANLRAVLLGSLQREFEDMHAFGREEASRQLTYYGFTVQDSMQLSPQVQWAVDAALAKLDGQTVTIQALILTNAGEAQIIGDESRVGVLRATDVLAAGAFWAAQMVGAGFEYQLTKHGAADHGFQKQVIAALDNHTTDCCLKAHAQIQPLSQSFKLTGEPRFADSLEWTPFHWYCRSSVALYLPQFDDGLTARMRAGADQVILERSQGIWQDRHPADAYG